MKEIIMENSPEQQDINDADDQLRHIKGVVEALLFVNEKPVTLEQIKKVLETVKGAEIKKAIEALQADYDAKESGIMIIEIAGGYQMLSNPVYASYLRSFYKTKHKEKLSKPALESMAIIAYKQPVTRADIELIRGVNSDGVVAHLLNKDLIKLSGRKDVPGRPFVYGTTKQFLEYFGLKSLEDLPTLEEFAALTPITELGDGDHSIAAEDQAEVVTDSQDKAGPEESPSTVDNNLNGASMENLTDEDEEIGNRGCQEPAVSENVETDNAQESNNESEEITRTN